MTQERKSGHFDTLLTVNERLKLYAQSWCTPEEHRGAVAIIHGLAEHSSRYGEMAEKLNAKGFNVHAFDLRGHGRSGGLRAHIDSIDDYLEDIKLFFDYVKKEEPADKPLFLFGHSMGGMLSILYYLRFKTPFAGLIVSGPALKAGEDISPVMIQLAKLMSRFFPKLPLQKLDHRSISHDPEVVKDYDQDPLNYRGGLRARLGFSMLQTFDEIAEKRSQFDLPILIMLGGADKIVDPEAGKEFFEHISSKDKKLVVLDGFYHEIMREVEKEKFYDVFLQWLDEHVS